MKLTVLACLGAALALVSGPAYALDLSGGASATSENVWRGYSVSGGEPGFNANIHASEGIFYVNLSGQTRSQLASFTSFDMTSTLGVRTELIDGVTVDGGVSYSKFFGSFIPGTDFLEMHLGAEVETGLVDVAVTGRFSPDYIFSTGDNWRVEGVVSRDFDGPLETTITPFAKAAHNTGAANYQDFGAGLRVSKGPIYLQGEYSDTKGLGLGGFAAVFADARAVVSLGVEL